MNQRIILRRASARWLAVMGVLLPACCSGAGGGPASGDAASAVQGLADGHCGPRITAIDPATCHAAATDGGVSTMHHPAGGDPYGPAMLGDAGDDDDCKYHVTWSAAGPRSGVTFTVVVVTKGDGLPARNVPVFAEVFLDETHPAPNTDQRSAETSSPGTFTVGPIAFDVTGRWTVRFHFHDDCDDDEQSPHGHAAFLVDVKD